MANRGIIALETQTSNRIESPRRCALLRPVLFIKQRINVNGFFTRPVSNRSNEPIFFPLLSLFFFESANVRDQRFPTSRMSRLVMSKD